MKARDVIKVNLDNAFHIGYVNIFDLNSDVRKLQEEIPAKKS